MDFLPYNFTTLLWGTLGSGSTGTNYDRTATVAASMYNPYNSPGAFVPHSAINLSVKSGAEASHSSLDLTLNENSATISNPSSYLGSTQVFGSSSGSSSLGSSR